MAIHRRVSKRTSQAFSKLLSEARKWRLSLVIAHQYIAQIKEEGCHEQFRRRAMLQLCR
jgi:hypothetical protein